MHEWVLVWRVPLALLVLGVFVLCYVIGGRTAKWIRRFIGGLVFAAGCQGLAVLAHTWSPWMLLSFPAYVLALSMGYSGNGLTLIGRLVKRFKYGLVLGLASGTLLIPSGFFLVFATQILLAMLISMIYGVWNPTKSAVSEEACIALVSVATVPISMF